MSHIKIHKKSFPFDYIPTTPALILKYLKNPDEFYPTKNSIKNNDGVWFGHFDTGEKYDETVVTFKRRFERLFNALRNKSKLLFVYTSEADIYNELGNRYNDNYSELCKIVEYLIETYGYDNFTIVAVHVNKTFANSKNILNYTINVPDNCFSDDMSTHTGSVYSDYRTNLNLLMSKIFMGDTAKNE